MAESELVAAVDPLAARVEELHRTMQDLKRAVVLEMVLKELVEELAADGETVFDEGEGPLGRVMARLQCRRTEPWMSSGALTSAVILGLLFVLMVAVVLFLVFFSKDK